MSCGITLQVDVPSSPHYLTTIHHYQKRKGHLLRWLKRIPPFLRIINHHSTIYQYKPPLSPCWFATKTSISLVDFPFSPDRPKPLRSRWALYDGWSECQGKRPRRTALWMVTRCRKTVWFAIATPKKTTPVFDENVQYLRIGSYNFLHLFGQCFEDMKSTVKVSSWMLARIPKVPDGWTGGNCGNIVFLSNLVGGLEHEFYDFP